MKPITQSEYFAGKPHNNTHTANAQTLLSIVNALMSYCETHHGMVYKCDVDTGTFISGSKGGSGDGGFRLTTATTGKALSSHKEGRGIDIYDEGNALDNLLDAHPELLEKFNLYREESAKTLGWIHLSTRPPKSGKRTFEI